MGLLKGQLAGKADMGVVSKLIKSKLTKVGFKKNYQVGKKWIFDDYSYLCKGLLIPFFKKWYYFTLI
jgi:hypothetical protein